MSQGPTLPRTPSEPQNEDPDSIVKYPLPLWRRCLIVFATSWNALSPSVSSTCLFTAVNEVANEFSTTPAKVNLSSAGVILAMGCASFIWVPIGTVIGRQWSYNICLVVLCLFTIGAALSPNMAVFVPMRVLSGLQGTYFNVAGQAIVAEHFPPTQRGTATGFFLAGTAFAPALGPCIAGIIITYANWRIILWVQLGMVVMGLVLSILIIPRTKTAKGIPKDDLTVRTVLDIFNPMHIIKLLGRPNIVLTDLACGMLSFSQYLLLSSPRHLISTRFHENSPLVSGLFYLAPGGGFLVGTFVGGRYSDHVVKKWIAKRKGVRIPQDRLNSGMFAFFIVVPLAFLVYGWSLDCTQCAHGLLPLSIVTSFFTAAGLLAAFASLNTYCAEVLPSRRIHAIATKYFIQYLFGATASASSIPMIDSIGIGPATTIGVVLVVVAGVLTLLTAKRGTAMQEWMEKRSLSTDTLENTAPIEKEEA